MKKVLVFFVVLVMCLSLVACENNQSLPTQSDTLDQFKTQHKHSFGKWTIVKDATCAETGMEERVCSCGEKETKSIAEKGHTFSEWTVAKDATCAEAGMEERVCSCGEKEIKTLSAKGHVIVVDTAITPKCESSGLTDGKHCSICNTVLKEQEYLSPLGHKWNEATCSSAKKCSTCNKTEGDVLEHLQGSDGNCVYCGMFIESKDCYARTTIKTITTVT